MRGAGFGDYFRVFSCTLRHGVPSYTRQFGRLGHDKGQSREGFPRSYH